MFKSKTLNATIRFVVMIISLVHTVNCSSTPTGNVATTLPNPTKTLSAYPYPAPSTEQIVGGYPISTNPIFTPPPPATSTNIGPLSTTLIPVATMVPSSSSWVMRYEKEINRQTDGLRDISIQSIAISPDGQLLAVGGGSPYYVITILNTNTGEVIRKIASHQSEKEWTL